MNSLPKPFYTDEFVTLYCGDNEELLPLLGKFNHVITDAPYDEKTHAGARGAEVRYGTGGQRLKFEPIDPAKVAPQLTLKAERWVVNFCAMEQLGEYKKSVGELWVRAGFWKRISGMPQMSGDRPAQPGEGIAIWHVGSGRKEWNGGGKPAFYEHLVVRGKARVHETQKPESLMIELVEDFTNPFETILDPYAGSGTTGVAAKRMGRRCVLIEQFEENCKNAVDRLRQSSMVFFEPPTQAEAPDLLSSLAEEPKE